MKSYDNGSQSDFEIISFGSVSPHIFMSKTPDDVLHSRTEFFTNMMPSVTSGALDNLVRNIFVR